MSVQTNGGAGQAPATGTPGQGQAPTGQQDQQGTGQAPGQGQQGTQGQQQQVQEAFDANTPLEQLPEAIRGYVASLRQEAARYRQEARTLQEQVQQFQRQNETAEQAAQREAQEAKARLQALEQENRDLKVGAQFQRLATEARALSPAALWDLVKGRGIQVDVDDKGNPTNIPAILAGLQQSDPYLFARTPQGADGGGAGGGTGPQGTDMNDWIRGRGRAAAR